MDAAADESTGPARKETAGDDLEDVLAAHLPRLQAFLRLRMGPALRARESSSDLAQSVCLDLLANKQARKLRDPRAVKAWLYRRAVNKLRERVRYHRAEKRNPQREAGTPSEIEIHTLAGCYAELTPSREAVAREDLQRFEQAFDRLSSEHQEIITLVRVLRVPHAEAARLMNRTEQASRALLNRAMLRLVSLLDPGGAS